MKKFVIIACLIIAFLLMLLLQKKSENDANKDLLKGKYYVDIEIEKYGTISLELDADAAPITVTNFIKLVDAGYYNGTKLHRIMKGFMMQGGQGAETDTIKGEFASNGVKNDISHVRGVISMARADDKNSASSQFFIVHEDSTFLDGNYAGFGHVTKGIEVVDNICKDAKPTDDNGTIEESKMPVIKTITRREITTSK